ncbi:photosystem II biogenesis protein Psp29 [Pleurocapsa sp. FMAR1]|uniref:photosystem II biogenesis protein Psp29 n=1 Tax=Pleurocapsa sp. FMAR1 TaxID=3040204 RepID=UPI0029C84C21|nr:photosystem II biogenesis protein Psp29 [Pleurocapsa sp. FMAR1]
MKTVSDSKRAFYAAYPRPINSIYRRVIEELLVEMHLLSVNADFKPDPVYYLGIVTSFERLMQGYQPESDKEKIFNAICTSTDGDPQNFKSQAGILLTLAKDKSIDELMAWLSNPSAEGEAGYIVEPIKAIANNDNFKYSRPFAIGVYTLLEECDSKAVQNQEKRDEIVGTIAESFGLPSEKMKKDLELYRSNLEKMEQLLKVIEDVLEASRKKREKREQEKIDLVKKEDQVNEEVEEATAE